MKISKGETLNSKRLGIFLVVTWLAAGTGNRWTAAQDSPQTSNPREVSGSETGFKIRSERNVVLARVVVRDRDGNAIGGLHKEDFRLFDNGKPQTITEFSIEPAGTKAQPTTASKPPEQAATPATAAEAEPTAVMPDRFVALYFDDVHLVFEDTVRTRDAAKKYLGELQPGDRAAIVTSSGRLSQDFTADRDKLTQALDRLQPHPIISQSPAACPDISVYQAHQIEAQQPDAIELATLNLIDCQCAGDPRQCPNVSQEAQSFAMQVIESDELQSRYSLRELESLVRHLASMPGQRSIVLVSPGFFSDKLKFELSQITDRALRARVIINTLDARGLYTIIPGGDASVSNHSSSMQYFVLKEQFDRANEQVNADVLSELAAETGGVFFQNSNDYGTGFRRTGGLPETSYVLSFSPQQLKFDGSFHKLKVTLVNPSGLTAQARRGYFAPRKTEDAALRVKEEIEEAVFSRDEIHEMPLDVNTQFFKTDNFNARLSVVAHVDLRSVHFRKENGRNADNLTLIAALFDSDGNYVTAKETTIEMQLKDATLDKATQTGISLKTSLDTKVGNYFMRVVVRDSESTRISTLNRTIEIPY